MEIQFELTDKARRYLAANPEPILPAERRDENRPRAKIIPIGAERRRK